MGLYFHELEIGQSWRTVSRTITETDVVNFCGLSGDFDPLHSDEESARRSQFGGRIAHGPLVLGVAHGLFGRLGLVDGTGVALLGFDAVRFTAPVRLGDTITVRIVVVEKKLSSKGDRGTVRFSSLVINQNEVTVATLDTLCLVKASRTT